MFKMDLLVYRRLMAEIVLTKNYGCIVTDMFPADDECNICMNPLKDSATITLSCSKVHTYHKDCFLHNLVDYRYIKCPDCLEPIKKPDKSISVAPSAPIHDPEHVYNTHYAHYTPSYYEDTDLT